jgi:hypothetical protein
VVQQAAASPCPCKHAGRVVAAATGLDAGVLQQPPSQKQLRRFLLSQPTSAGLRFGLGRVKASLERYLMAYPGPKRPGWVETRPFRVVSDKLSAICSQAGTRWESSVVFRLK